MPRSWHRPARSILGELEHVAGLPGGVVDAEDCAEGLLLEGEADVGLLGQIVKGTLRIVDEPVELQIATAAQRLIAGNGVGGAILVPELDEARVLALDFETEDVDVEALHRLDVGNVLQGETEPRFGDHRMILLRLHMSFTLAA